MDYGMWTKDAAGRWHGPATDAFPTDPTETVDTDGDGSSGDDAADNVQSASNAALTVNQIPITSATNQLSDVNNGDLSGWNAYAKVTKGFGKKLDLGKSCLRFNKVEDLALELIGDAIRGMPVDKHIAFYENTLKNSRKKVNRAEPAKATKRLTKPPAAAAICLNRRLGEYWRSEPASM